MNLITYLTVGLLGVSNMILWGVYGDLCAEEFKIKKIFRSLLLAVVFSIFLFLINPNLNAIYVLLSVIGLERIVTEIYKIFIRVEDQSKYKIPSDLSLKFPIFLKRSLGLFLIAAVFYVVYLLNSYTFDKQKIIIPILLGFVVAIGGMSKDAPHEGFEPFKFFRSPIVAFVVGVLLGLRNETIPAVILFLSVAGGERIVSEMYKKVIRKKIPGKFKTEKKNGWREKRKLLLPLYFLNLLLIISTYFFS